MQNARSSDATDRLLLVLGAIIVTVMVAWYAFLFVISLLKIQLTNDPTPFLAASVSIRSTGTAALLLLIGWRIQRERMHPPVLFLAFVAFEISGWVVELAASVWTYLSLRSGTGFSYELLSGISTAAAILVALALFFLILLAMPPGTQPRIPQPGTPPPAESVP